MAATAARTLSDKPRLEKDIEPLFDPPFGIEGKKAVAFNPGNGVLFEEAQGL